MTPEETIGDTTLQRGASEMIEPLTVLLVDDDSSIQTILYQLLEEGGYNVLAAGNGMDALDICRQCKHPIDLLLTDVEMPGMSGFDLAEHALQLQPLMKVLFMSGDADNGTLRLEGFQGRSYVPRKAVRPGCLDAQSQDGFEMLAQSNGADEQGSSNGLFSAEGGSRSPFAVPQ